MHCTKYKLKTSIERHKLSNYPKPYSKWKRYCPVSSQYLIIDQRIEMRFLNLFNALRPSTSSTLSSGCRPLVKFLKNTLFRENHIVTHETVLHLELVVQLLSIFINNWQLNWISFRSQSCPKNASNSLDSGHDFYSKDFTTQLPGAIFQLSCAGPLCLTWTLLIAVWVVVKASTLTNSPIRL